MNGKIINITRFSTNDGPGIRTTVFLKGCPLNCLWCHNPESQQHKIEIMYNNDKCMKCMRCFEVCKNGCHEFDGAIHKYNIKNCITCERCVEMCPAKALEAIGKTASSDEILKEVKKDTAFYKASGGGVTISDGEPLYQPEFTAEILKLCKKAT